MQTVRDKKMEPSFVHVDRREVLLQLGTSLDPCRARAGKGFSERQLRHFQMRSKVCVQQLHPAAQHTCLGKLQLGQMDRMGSANFQPQLLSSSWAQPCCTQHHLPRDKMHICPKVLKHWPILH